MKSILQLGNVRVDRGTFTLNVARLHVAPGNIVCITGPNGSGKTTFIDCLAGLIIPNTGTITIHGKPINNNVYTTKSTVGLIPDDENWLINELSAHEYFNLLAGIYKKAGITSNMSRRVNELAAALHFTAMHQQLGTLSHGNKKKVQIVAALMHQPSVIIIDELRNGPDPLAIIAAENIVKQEAARGACIVAATHDLWWAQRFAHTVAVLLNGSIKVQQKTTAIVGRYGSLEALFTKTVESAQ